MELIVSMALTTLVLSMVVGFFVQITSATIKANESRSTTALGSNIANELADVIRPATTLRVVGSTAPDPALVAATNTSLTIYAFADNTSSNVRPIRVSFSQDAKKQLVEKRWNATTNATTGLWEFPALGATPASTRVFPGALIDPSVAVGAGASETAPLFVYLDSASQVVVPSGTGLTLAQRSTIAAIRFTVRTRTDTSATAQPVAIQNTVGMPNLGLQSKDDS
ncbi:hypothetical protein IWX81_002076 [Salinibacterium sp. CAN_S4]|uniref:hypothetical protein n=1 Tax=Salinibacterium sp. CAN_S4 TaxID=2787727 RepID=UPI0018F02D33